MKQIHLTIYLLSILLASQGVYAQRFMYVHDHDLYVNVRSGAGSQHPVIWKVYNLQLVKIVDSDEINGWLEVDWGTDQTGFIHRSRLVGLPENLTYGCNSMKNGICFIASQDCPEIVVYLYFNPSIIPHKDVKTEPIRFTIKDDMFIKNIQTGQVIDEVNAIGSSFASFYVSLFSGRLVFVNDYYLYSFYRNQRGELCRGLTLLSDSYLNALNNKELEVVIRKAKEAVNEAKMLAETISESQEYKRTRVSYDGIGKHIETNDFDYLRKLEQAYYMGNSDAEELFPYILEFFPIDGEGTHAIEDFYTRLNGFQNRGEIVL